MLIGSFSTSHGEETRHATVLVMATLMLAWSPSHRKDFPRSRQVSCNGPPAAGLADGAATGMGHHHPMNILYVLRLSRGVSG